MASSQDKKIQSADLVSLADRMVYVQALRMGLAAVVLGTALLAPQLVHAQVGELTLAAAAYLVCSAGVEVFRRTTGARSLRALNWMLLADGLFVAWAMYATGGTQSPLRFLAYLHIIAVTLAASYRTGLKIALWHSLLFFVVFYSQASGWLAAAQPVSQAVFQRTSVFNVLALWLVALTTASFSAVNERQLRRRRDDLASLAAFAGRLQETTTPDEIAEALIDSLRKSFGLHQVVVVAGHDGPDELIAMHPEPPAKPSGIAEDNVVQEALRTKKTVLTRRLDAEANPGLARLLPFARNLVFVPLVAENRPVGVLVGECGSRVHSVERRIVSMLEQFSAQASLALRNAWLLEQVHTLARTDALTGVANRRTFQESLAHELSRAGRAGDPLTLVMIDVDHFKAYNDEHGHPAGDRLLQAVAAALVEESRDFDTVARYGGEEFTVILPGCTSRQSVPAAERLRRAIARIDDPAAVTVSAGVATFPTHCTDAEALIRAADDALYDSKRAGRDRVSRTTLRALRRKVPEASTSAGDYA